MATYAIFLRAAANVEQSLVDIQDILFRRHGLASARLFPPVVPLCSRCVHGMSADQLVRILERERKKHPLRLESVSLSRIEQLQAEPVSVPLVLHGFDQLCGALSDLLTPDEVGAEENPILSSTAARFVLAWETGEFHSPPHDSPDTLTWAADPSVGDTPQEHASTDSSRRECFPVTLPETGAFWLWAVELYPAEYPRWWDGAQWYELFSRRTTVVYR